MPPVLGLYPGPLLLAAAYGLLTALAFSLWPLGRAARIPGGALFRDALLPERTRPSRPLLAANADRRGGPDRAHHRRRNRFAIAHFTDENDFRRLAQRGAQTGRIKFEILPKFALVEGRLFVR